MKTFRIIILSIIVAVIIFDIGYFSGYVSGGYYGAGKALDTINVMLDKQIKSDTSITKLILINPDTNTYIISRKTILKK